jgi:molybdopterin/thiamine biosynthesis adenylyltransferase
MTDTGSEMELTEEQLQRYSRHILIQEVGLEGLKKIRRSKVLIIGVGGLGSANALYLAAAGVGAIGLVDGDVVDLSNLQRQVIHFTPDTGKSKIQSALEKINAMNPDVQVNSHPTLVKANNIRGLISDYDFVIDATDNFPAKFLINDACVLSNKPFSHGGVIRFEGQTLTHTPGHACYRCIFSAPPPKDLVPTSLQVGILGSVAGMLGTIQATEALKFFTGAGELLTNRLLIFDAATMNFRTVEINRNPSCPICGDHPTITSLTDEI